MAENNIGPKRLVVGAHYGMRDWLAQRVTAIITSDGCRDLNLKVGEPAVALIKATEVMVGKPGK